MKTCFLKIAVAVTLILTFTACHKAKNPADGQDSRKIAGTWARYNFSTINGLGHLQDTVAFTANGQYVMGGTTYSYYLQDGYFYYQLSNDAMRSRYTLVNNDSLLLTPEWSFDEEYRLKRIK